MNKVKHPTLTFLKFSYKANKKYYYVMIFNCLVGAFATIFNAYSLSLLISSLETKTYQQTLIVGFIIVIINFIIFFLNKYLNQSLKLEQERMNFRVNEEISYILMTTDFEHIEDPYYLELKERAKLVIENQGSIYGFIKNLADIIQGIISLIGLAAIIITFDYIIIVAVLISFVIFTIFTIYLNKTLVIFFNDLLPINHHFGYYYMILSEPLYGKDFRFYPVGNLMEKQYQNFASSLENYSAKMGKKMAKVSAIQSFFKVVENAFVYCYIIIKTIVLRLSVASFSLYVSMALNLSTVLQSLVSTTTNFLRYNSYLVSIIDLITLPNLKKKGLIKFEGEIETIEFKNVTFSYPKNDEIILDDVSFKINKNEKISLVGLNGAGKTTIVKLICRLYQVNKGEILINGKNILEYDYDSYIQKISCVFQDYKIFAYSIKENIVGDNGDEHDALNLASKVGLKEKIDSLKDGINTLYGKSFDEKGVELSGGEAQKIAIARALYTSSSLIILDEPTSALDPLIEAEIYASFNDLVQNKTAIYISHRMSSSVFCDKILLLNKGKIEAFAPHSELIKDQNSLYYKLFNAQAKNYQS